MITASDDPAPDRDPIHIDTFSNSYRTADMFVPVLFIAAISVTILQIPTR